MRRKTPHSLAEKVIAMGVPGFILIRKYSINSFINSHLKNQQIYYNLKVDSLNLPY